MNRLFDVGNKARNGQWIAAPDSATALQISLKLKHIKKIDHGDPQDVTDAMQSDDAWETLKAILESGKNGVVGKKVPMLNAAQLFGGLAAGPQVAPAEPSEWIMILEVEIVG